VGGRNLSKEAADGRGEKFLAVPIVRKFGEPIVVMPMQIAMPVSLILKMCFVRYSNKCDGIPFRKHENDGTISHQPEMLRNITIP